MVSTQDEEIFWVFDLVGKEEADGLERLLSTIDVISKEKVVGLWGESAVLEKAEEIIVLAVNVTTNL